MTTTDGQQERDVPSDVSIPAEMPAGLAAEVIECRPPEEMDIATAPAFGEYLATLDAGRRVTLDMSGVRFIDSFSLRILEVAHTRFAAAGGRFVLKDPTPNLRRLLNITGLDQHFVVEVSPS